MHAENRGGKDYMGPGWSGRDFEKTLHLVGALGGFGERIIHVGH